MWAKGKNNNTWALVAIIAAFTSVYLLSSLVDFAVIKKKDTAKDQATTQTQQKPEKVAEKPLIISAAGNYGYNQNTFETFSSMSKQDPSYILALGDLSSGEASEDAWCEKTTEYIGKKPLVITPGERDVEQTTQLQKLVSCLPNRIAQIEGSYPANYYFDHQKLARVISISPALTINSTNYGFKKSSKEFSWLEKTIDEARTQKIRWIIVNTHKNCINMTDRSCAIGQDLQDLLIAKKVDLVIQAQEEAYTRTHQLAHTEKCTSISPARTNSDACVITNTNNTYKHGQGSVQLNIGTAGVELKNLNLQAQSKNLYAFLSALNTNPTYGSVKLSITNNQIKSEFIDNTSLKTVDSFLITYSDK